MDDTIGARLRKAREQRHLSLAEVSEITRVRSKYLQALESDDLSAVPSTAQARGFLRIYADYLGMALDDLAPAAAADLVAAEAESPHSPGPQAVPSSKSFLAGFVSFLERRLSGRAAEQTSPERSPLTQSAANVVPAGPRPEGAPQLADTSTESKPAKKKASR